MKQNLYERPVKEALMIMTAPALAGMVSTFLFQLVDTYFVGKLGTQELAAMSFSYPIYFLMVSMFMGIASGVSSSVGKALGENKLQKTKTLTTISSLVFAIIAFVLGVLGYFTITPVFSLLGASEELLPLISDYMQTLYLGMFTLVISLNGISALMAKGITTKPQVIMGIGGVINLVLDYILIFGLGPIPAFGLQGAAIATVLSWVAILIMMLRAMIKAELLSIKAIASFHRTMDAIKEIFTIGLPAVAAQVLTPIAITIVTRIVSQSGAGAVAAYGIATRIEALGLTGIMALSVILTPLVAQNFGAKQQDRLDQVIALSGRMAVYWGILLYVIILLFADSISSIFTDNQEIMSHIQNYLYIIGISFPGFGLALITTSFFNGVYMPKDSLKVTLVKSLGFTIPFAIVGSLFSLNGVWIGLAIANIAGAIYAGRLLNKWLAKNDSSLVGYNPSIDYLNDFKNFLSIWKIRFNQK